MSVYDEFPPCDHDDCSKLKCNHAAPSQPTELDKAVALHIIQRLRAKHLILERFQEEEIKEVVEAELSVAAKRAQALEKDRDDAVKYNVIVIGERDKLRDDLKVCAETSKSISIYVCHTSDCYSQKTSPTTYSDPMASTCDCGLRDNMIDYHKAVARLSVQADLKVCE